MTDPATPPWPFELTSAVADETRWQIDSSHQRVRDIEGKAAWGIGFAGVFIVLMLEAMPALLTSGYVLDDPCIRWVMAAVLVLTLLAAAVGGVLALMALTIFRYDGIDVDSLLAVAEKARAEHGAATFVANLPGVHRKTILSLTEAADSKVDKMRWAMRLLSTPIIASPAVATLFVVAIATGK